MKCKNCGKEMQHTHYMSYVDKNPNSEDLTHTDGYAWFCADCVQTVKISESKPHRNLEIKKET
jgi:predicted amidophosphoribosyltransferase